MAQILRERAELPVTIIGAPIQAGAGRPGCEWGPAALRAAGLVEALRAAGAACVDAGDTEPAPWHAAFRRSNSPPSVMHPNPAVRNLAEVAAWVTALDHAAFTTSATSVPLFIGGDHSLSAGTVSGMARRAQAERRPLFVLWLDAHPDCHTLETTTSGNLHGVPMAYLMGKQGFAGYLPPLLVRAAADQVCVMGVRDVDAAEWAALHQAGVVVHEMPGPALEPGALETGASESGALDRFLNDVRDADGLLHVSFDTDVLDPSIAPGTGTPVPGGLDANRAHRVMRMLRDSGLVRSIDLVELNPSLDPDGRTARLLLDLAVSLCGQPS